MKRILLIALLAAAPAQAQLYPNPYEYQGQNRVQQRYNPFENRWETTQGHKELKFNPYQQEWSYENPGAQPVYNPYENRWEYPK